MIADIPCFVFVERFINGRRRILQPMLDNSSTTDTSKAKKNKGTSRSAQRFWPENIAKLNPNTTTADDSNSQHSTANEVCPLTNLI